ncbi:phage tail-collar fiber domain-containing protein [Companilactobacillus sp. HBUAS59699]|uniref:phage tail-collar fiber domain-containing protein n=1 Tax=Companilactobacillus sp. HBUAS59699 TaxID=3109358 RepID=UPI002FF16AB2
MSKYNESILTTAGLDLASRAANGKTKFTITRATSTGDDLTTMSEEDLQKLTELPNEVQTGVIANKDENIPNSNSVIGTELLFTNNGLKEGYSINTVALYAKEDGKDTEILYALTTAQQPEYMPDFADQVLLQFRLTIYVIVGRTENVEVTVDPTGMASKEYVDSKFNDINTDDVINNSETLVQLQMMSKFLEDK